MHLSPTRSFPAGQMQLEQSTESGVLVGSPVGLAVVGLLVGATEGLDVDDADGDFVGRRVAGVLVGKDVSSCGELVGSAVFSDGTFVGAVVVGADVGLAEVGSLVGGLVRP